MEIAIIGCGIGGLACALYLSKTSSDVTLFDKFDHPAPVGSGLVVQPVGQDVLRELGCAEALLDRGEKIYKMSGTESGSHTPVLHVDYGPKGGPIFGIGIHRSALFDILFQAMQATNTQLKTKQIIEQSYMKDGKRFIVNQDGTIFGPFDLVIDTSGARSSLSPIKARALEFGALWGTVDWVEDSALPKQELTQCYSRANKMMGVLPIGRLPDGPSDDRTRKATIFWSEPRGSIPDWPQNNLQDWKDEAISLWPEFAPYINQITRAEQMTATRYSHGTLYSPYQDRLAILGDAAHQASPQLGQGANMALLDARALSMALEQHDINTALKVYARKRFAHVRLYQVFSAVFTPFYQSDSKILPWIRNYVMYPFSRIWPVKAMLTRLVCGTLIKPK